MTLSTVLCLGCEDAVPRGGSSSGEAYEPGLVAEFFDFTTSLSALLDLSGLAATVSRVDASIDYAPTTAAWPGLPASMADTFASRHTGFLHVPTAGVYTLYLSSDDGSRLWLDGDLVVDNDGLHSVREAAGQRTLTAGDHALRVEFFENWGDAGLVLSWSGPGIAKQVVPASALFHAAKPDPAPGPAPTPVVETTVNYLGSTLSFPNPERGFAYENDVPWPNQITWDFCGSGNNFTAYNYVAWNTPLTVQFLQEERAQGRSVIMSRYHLADFRDRDLTPEYLTFLRNDFATVRQAGMKNVVHFAYNYPMGGPDAPLDRILHHLDQLKPVLQDNADVIAFMEAGFVGCWGEWHTSSNGLASNSYGISDAERQILDKILDVLPAERMVAIRYPRLEFDYFGNADVTPIAPLTVQTAFSGSKRARVGHEDDCFVCNDSHGGSYLNPRGDLTEVPKFLQQENLFVPQGGESGDPPSGDSPLSSCPTILNEFKNIHWSIVGLYNTGSATCAVKRWEQDGCLEEIKQRLGYRYRMVRSESSARVVRGGQLRLKIEMVNDGWANAYNPRRLELVLRSKNGAKVTTLPGFEDARLKLPNPGETTTIDLSLTLPASLDPGQFDVLLNLPDPKPSLYGRPEYSIRLANDDVWEPQTGFNFLHQTLEVTN